MLPELKNMVDQKWGIISFQLFVLALDLYLIFEQNIINSFILLSVICIMSLFCLQIVSRRFTLLYPIQQKLNEPTPMVDTHLLKIIIMLGVFTSIAGGIQKYSPHLQFTEPYLSSLLVVLFPILILILPLAWLFYFDGYIRQKLISKLGEKVMSGKDICPKCAKLREYEIKVIGQNQLLQKYKCECGDIEINSPISIGY